MPKKKVYRAVKRPTFTTSVGVPRVATVRGVLIFEAELPKDARPAREHQVDLRSWLGQGIDAWVDAVVQACRSLLAQGKSPQSVTTYARSFEKLLEFFIRGYRGVLLGEIANFRPLHVTAFVGWLRSVSAGKQWSAHTTANYYAGVKAILQQLLKLHIIEGDPKRFFPARPFENGHGSLGKQTAFSEEEMRALARALKADVADAHHGRLAMRPAESISCRYLIVTMRTGGNPTPLFEMSRSSPKPGLLPGSKVVPVMKHRAAKVVGLMFSGRTTTEPLPIPTDAAAILDMTLRETASLVALAPKRFKDRVWLYTSSGGSTRGEVTCLNYDSLSYCIGSMVERRGLLGDDGRPLRVNASRLRKSFGKRAFRLTGGDIVATANLLGNKPSTTDSRYLNVDEEAKAEGAVFVTADLVREMRGDKRNDRVVAIRADINALAPSIATPVAGCVDSLRGEHAPKDGVHYCHKFVMCIFCSSFAIVGELDELWRLFSFQTFAKQQLERLDVVLCDDDTKMPVQQKLRKLYRAAVPHIDLFTQKHFAPTLVVAARKKALASLHPFWKCQVEFAGQAPW